MLSRMKLFLLLWLGVSMLIVLVIFYRTGVLNSLRAVFSPKPAASIVPSPINSTAVRVGPAPPFTLSLPALSVVEGPKGFLLGVFAKDLGSPRDLQLSPGGVLLASIPAQNRVVALPDRNNDGIADQVVDIVKDLRNPHGIAFFNGKLFIAEETSIKRYLWDESDLVATFDKELFNLPQGGNHVTRSIIFDKKGALYVSIGSSCNVCFESDDRRAAIMVSDADGNSPQVYAKGLRNTVFMAGHPQTGELWGADMGRDYLGDFTPPDEINVIKSNRDYGWPLCYGGKIHDTVFDNNQYIVDPCAKTEPAQFGFDAHTAPLGLKFIESQQFPLDWQNDLLVSLHGSWNRTSPIGYKIVHLKLSGNDVVSQSDFLWGFLNRDQKVVGRPVDVEFDSEGSLFISDDKNGMIYKVIAEKN